MQIVKRQRGMTVIGGLILLALVGFMVYVIGFVAVPIYLEYFQIRKGFATIAEDIHSYDTSPAEIRKRIERHFSLEYTKSYDYRKPIIKKQKGTISVELVYQDKRAIFNNLYMMLDVNESIQLYPRL